MYFGTSARPFPSVLSFPFLSPTLHKRAICSAHRWNSSLGTHTHNELLKQLTKLFNTALAIILLFGNLDDRHAHTICHTLATTNDWRYFVGSASVKWNYHAATNVRMHARSRLSGTRQWYFCTYISRTNRTDEGRRTNDVSHWCWCGARSPNEPLDGGYQLYAVS